MISFPSLYHFILKYTIFFYLPLSSPHNQRRTLILRRPPISWNTPKNHFGMHRSTSSSNSDDNGGGRDLRFRHVLCICKKVVALWIVSSKNKPSKGKLYLVILRIWRIATEGVRVCGSKKSKWITQPLGLANLRNYLTGSSEYSQSLSKP